MMCVICRHGRTYDGTATVTLERGSLTLVVKNVPARICDNCGEEYIDEQTVARLLADAEQAAWSGFEVVTRAFAAA